MVFHDSVMRWHIDCQGVAVRIKAFQSYKRSQADHWQFIRQFPSGHELIDDTGVGFHEQVKC